MKLISVLLFTCTVCCHLSVGALVMFVVDSSTGDIEGISNCSCVFGSPTCTSDQLLASSFCTCIPSPASKVAEVADNATAAGGVSWWNTEALSVCCKSTNTDSAKALLEHLINFSHTSKLTLDHCEGLTVTTEQLLTVYGLQEVNIQTDTSANHPQQYISITETDKASANKRSREYRDHHIAFIGKRTLDGDAELKSFSVWALPEDTNAELVQTAINRAPDSIKSKSDGSIMYTAVYV